MKYQSLYGFYWFGTCLRYLQDVSVGLSIKNDSSILFNLKRFFEYLDELQLVVTSRLGHRKLDALLEEFENGAADAVLTKSQSETLKNALRFVRETLEAEIEGVGAYTPTPKRLDLKRLLEDVSQLFAPDVFSHLPKIAQFDFSEAGKCISFETPTAAAFHILRGTEATLRFYYSSMIKQNRIKSNLWGNLVADLKIRNNTKDHAPLNNHLDNIRVSFRNPTQHPEATYDIHEVQDLWAVCVDVVNRMMTILKKDGKI